MLDTITKAQPRPPVITICGEPGTGKTSFGATMPKPIFIRAEDGVLRIAPGIDDPDCFPVLTSAKMLWEQISALINDDHSYRTLIIDSVPALDALFAKKILDAEPGVDGLGKALGGYGNGQKAVLAMHQGLIRACEKLKVERGMAIVFICHSDVQKVTPPDGEDYTRYTLRLEKDVAAAYVEYSDFVGFIRFDAKIEGEKKQRKIIVSNGDREIVCHASASSVAKNGYGIKEPIFYPMSENPMLPYFKAGRKAAAKSKPKPQSNDTINDDDQPNNED